jgi:hypothetical protein
MKNFSVGLLSLASVATTLVAQPTVVATPTTGELGSVIQLSVTPPTPGYELTSETSGIWFGNYTSTGGVSPFFTTTYSGSEIIIIDDWTAEVVLGAGVFASKVEPIDATVAALLAPNGTLNGTYQLVTPNPCAVDLNENGTLNFFDISIFLAAFANRDPIADFNGDGTFNFFDISIFLQLFAQGCGPISVDMDGPISMGFTAEPAQWHMVYYPGGWAFGLDPQLVESSPTEMGIFPVSKIPGVIYDDSMLGAVGMIYGITLDVENNATTASGNPATISVDVFTVDSSNNEIDRITGLILANEGVVDGRVRFSSRLLENVILTDSVIDDSQITGLVSLRAVNSGNVFIVLSIGG